MSILPETVTPEELAKTLGWSERRLKSLARDLGACRILGNRMVFTKADVAIFMLASKPSMTTAAVLGWLAEDAAEQYRENEFQRFADPTGVVYFIQRGTEIKIGFTNNLAKRLTNLRTGTTEQMSVLLTVPGVPALERYFHEKFAKHHLVREWFAASEELLNFIARRSHRQ